MDQAATSSIHLTEFTKGIILSILASSSIGGWLLEIISDKDFISNIIQWPVAVLTTVLLFIKVRKSILEIKNIKAEKELLELEKEKLLSQLKQDER